MNEIVLFLLVLLSLSTILTFYKIFDKRGLYFSTTILSLISFIFSFKLGYIFRLNVNLGIISLISVFSIIYIYLIKYDKKNIKDLVIVTGATNIIISLLLVVLNYYIPSITETISINIEGTFETNYKILITYPIIVALSQYIIIKLYSFITSISDYYFVSLLLTYIITGLIYTIIFYILAYINILNIKDSIFLGISTYIVGLIVHILNIIFILYITKSKKVTK